MLERENKTRDGILLYAAPPSSPPHLASSFLQLPASIASFQLSLPVIVVSLVFSRYGVFIDIIQDEFEEKIRNKENVEYM